MVHKETRNKRQVKYEMAHEMPPAVRRQAPNYTHASLCATVLLAISFGTPRLSVADREIVGAAAGQNSS